MLSGAEADINKMGNVATEGDNDIVQVFVNTGEQDIGYWEFIDVQGTVNLGVTPAVRLAL